MGKRKKQRWKRYAGIALLVLAVLAFGLFVFLQLQKQPPEIVAEDTVVVTINGKPLMQSQLDFQYNLLPSSYKDQLSKEEVLEQIIDEELVVQKAEQEGIVVSPEDINTKVQEILARNGITATDLQLNLAQSNITMEQFEALITRQLALERYIQTVINVSEPDDQALKDLYDLSKEKFLTPATVTVRHVLISTQREDAALRAKDVYDTARAGADFCELALNYSDDRGSKGSCGEYTFPKGVMVPEFEQASFEMQPGEYRLIQTQFGYHVLLKVTDSAEGVKPYEEVKELLAADYQNAEYLRQYKILTSSLREKAKIVYANGTIPAVEDVPEPVEEQAPEQEEVESPQDVLSCIAQKSVLYGASWDSDTKEALKTFANTELQYVACDQTECTVRGYPTWVVNGREYLGRMTLEELKLASDC